VTDAPPTEKHDRPMRTAPSLLLVHTGDGKGKSSSAFGVVLRAVARGWPVAVVQFLKSGEWNTGEERILSELGVEWHALGEGFTWDSADLSEDQAIAADAWRQARSLIESGDHRLVVLDEVTYPMNWGWIDTDEVVEVLRSRPERTSVVCTGRDAPAALIEIADTVTEMRNVKHAFDAGIVAKKGIDY
jgi:cob(I)alamin adenosyltransferase